MNKSSRLAEVSGIGIGFGVKVGVGIGVGVGEGVGVGVEVGVGVGNATFVFESGDIICDFCRGKLNIIIKKDSAKVSKTTNINLIFMHTYYHIGLQNQRSLLLAHLKSLL